MFWFYVKSKVHAFAFEDSFRTLCNRQVSHRSYYEYTNEKDRSLRCKHCVSLMQKYEMAVGS